jgi:hypothetical protein
MITDRYENATHHSVSRRTPGGAIWLADRQTPCSSVEQKGSLILGDAGSVNVGTPTGCDNQDLRQPAFTLFQGVTHWYQLNEIWRRPGTMPSAGELE